MVILRAAPVQCVWRGEYELDRSSFASAEGSAFIPGGLDVSSAPETPTHPPGRAGKGSGSAGKKGRAQQFMWIYKNKPLHLSLNF